MDAGWGTAPDPADATPAPGDATDSEGGADDFFEEIGQAEE